MFERLPVTQAVARRIQEMIRSGELAADQKIPSQRVLSERFGVSRASLREALLTLETLGLVRTYPARGTFVTGPQTPPQGVRENWRYENSYELEEVFQTRLLIEGELARLAAGALDTEGLTTLRRHADTFEKAWREGDLVAHVEADLAFHSAIAAVCPNAMLQRLYGSIQDLLTETQRRPIPNTETSRMQASIEEHQNILAALEQADPKAAATAMRAHISNTAACAGVQLK